METSIDFEIKKIRQWIENAKRGTLQSFLESLHPVNIAEIIDRLDSDEEKVYIVELLDHETAAEVIAELNSDSEKAILENIDNRKLSEIFSEMPSDDAADVISEMPEDKAEDLFAMMDMEDSRRLQELMKYPEDSAGGIMNIDFIQARADMTVSGMLRNLQHMELGEFHSLYLCDEDQKLIGKVKPMDLLLAKGDKKLRDIMETDVITVKPEMDQEEVANLFSKYDLITIPVIDDEGQMIGRITVDDIIDVITEEANEDIYKMAGTDEDGNISASIFKVASIRLPWLLITLLGGLMSCALLKFFRATLSETLALAFFVPIITAMGGNIGIQSSTTVVRGLATGELMVEQMWRILWKELRVGISMGIICGSIVGAWAVLSGESALLGLIVGFSMLIAITVAATVGSYTPLMLKKLKIDPTVSSGPFVTMSNDITGLIIYLSLATVLLRYFHLH